MRCVSDHGRQLAAQAWREQAHHCSEGLEVSFHLKTPASRLLEALARRTSHVISMQEMVMVDG